MIRLLSHLTKRFITNHRRRRDLEREYDAICRDHAYALSQLKGAVVREDDRAIGYWRAGLATTQVARLKVERELHQPSPLPRPVDSKRSAA